MDYTSPTFLVIVGIIFTALVFDFLNGFHDAANSIATVVSTRVLSPGQAVLWAAFFNFVAAFGFGVGVAKTIGSGMIDPNAVDQKVIFAGLEEALSTAGLVVEACETRGGAGTPIAVRVRI